MSRARSDDPLPARRRSALVALLVAALGVLCRPGAVVGQSPAAGVRRQRRGAPSAGVMLPPGTSPDRRARVQRLSGVRGRGHRDRGPAPRAL